MKKYTVLFLAAVLLTAMTMPAWASLAEATATLVEGAVGLPTSLVKLVGGILLTVGEVIIFPFTAVSS